jgi:hypothetical protein
MNSFLICSLLILSLSISANTKQKMRAIFDSYSKLVPFIYGPDKKNDQIKKHLDEFERNLRNSRHLSQLKYPNLSPSFDILSQNISEIKANYTKETQDYTKYRLRRVLSACISCHQQLPAHEYKKIQISKQTQLQKNMDRSEDLAMFAYFLRDYKKAVSHLNHGLSEQIKDKMSFLKAEKTITDIVKISLINLNDIDGTIKFIRDIKKSVPEFSNLFAHMPYWLTSLETWKGFDQKKMNQKKINSLIKTKLEPIKDSLNGIDHLKHIVNLYKMKGILSNYLVGKNNPKKPEYLYWLGLIENQSHSLFLYSLGERYLKKCITMAPKNPIAQKCFDEYKNSITYGYTGSMGTNIPAQVQKDLQKLQKKLK